MFWIHSGGLMWGTAADEFYNGKVLSILGDVVVVTINYRLNTFGLLYTGRDGQAQGNQALWDQSLAMEWVQDNIRYFGGDPQRVTIFGESAGAYAVSLHIVSPVSRHLFRNAILMSGGVGTRRELMISPEYAVQVWAKLAAEVGCGDSHIRPDQPDSLWFSQKMLDCLMSKPAHELIGMIQLWKDTSAGMFIVQDGQMMPREYFKMLESGDFKQGLNLLFGTVQDEGSVMLPLFNSTRFNLLAPEPLDYHSVRHEFRQILHRFRVDSDYVDQIVDYYFTGLSQESSSSDQFRQQLAVAVGDMVIGCDTIIFGQYIQRGDPGGAQVYQYYYNMKLGQPKMFCSRWSGACHFDDIYYLFGNPFIKPDSYLDEERLLSRHMIDVFSTFAKSDRPSRQSGAQWPAHYQIGDTLVKPYYEFSNYQKFPSNFGHNLKHIECNEFWKRF